MNLREEVEKVVKGEALEDSSSLEKYSKDASLFKVNPKLIVYPKDCLDLQALVKFVSENKKNDPSLSLTMRAAGSDMTGGPLNESIIADVTKHINKIGEIENESITVEPGAFYRDFEKKTKEKDLLLPCYPASKDLCAIGGMFSNNSGGEKTLRWGKMENYILESKVIFRDGKEYKVTPLSKEG